MKLTNLVSQHGFAPSDLGDIENAKLYQRQNQDGALELLCVQKIGNVFRVDRQALLMMGPMLLPLGEGLRNFIVPKDELEGFLGNTLTPATPQ